MTLEPHRLLQRQIKRYLGNSTNLPEDWQKFIAAVNDAYYQADDDRARIELTLELSSQELLQANTQMQALLQTVENQVAERTAELTVANAELENALQELRETQGILKELGDALSAQQFEGIFFQLLRVVREAAD